MENKQLREWAVTLIRAVALFALGLGSLRIFCHVFVISLPLTDTILLLGCFSFYFSLLASKLFDFLNEAIVNRFKWRLTLRPINAVLWIGTVFGSLVWGFCHPLELQEGANTLQEFVAYRVSLYYGGEISRKLNHAVGIEELSLLLYFAWFIIMFCFAWIGIEKKRVFLALLPIEILIVVGLFVGMVSGIRAMMLVCAGAVILIFMGDFGIKRRRGNLCQTKISLQERGCFGSYFVLILLLAGVGMAAVLAHLSQGKILTNEREAQFFEFEQNLEDNVEEKIGQVVQIVQEMTGVGEGVMGNSRPRYKEKSMMTVTVGSLPQKSIYLRGFTGGSYKNGKWWDENTFSEKFTEKDGEKLFSQGYSFLQNQEEYGGYLSTEMEISLENSNLKKYAFYPYNALYSKELTGFDANADFNIEQNTKKRSYQVDIYLEEYQNNLMRSNGSQMNRMGTEFSWRYNTFAQKAYCDVPEDLLQIQQMSDSLYELQGKGEIYRGYDDFGENMAYYVRRVLAASASYSLSLKPRTIGVDYVEDFLFNQKKGYCEHFATAGALLLRRMGIPARYVSGYRVDPSDFVRNKDGTYTAQVLDSDAHAWTEIYHMDKGWCVEEMTPSSNMSQEKNSLGVRLTQEIQQKTDLPLGMEQSGNVSSAPETSPTPTSESSSEKKDVTKEPTEISSEEEVNNKSKPEFKPTATPQRKIAEGTDDNLLLSKLLGFFRKYGKTMAGILAVFTFVFLLEVFIHCYRCRLLKKGTLRGERLLLRTRLLMRFLRQSGALSGTVRTDEDYARILSQSDWNNIEDSKDLYALLERAAYGEIDLCQGDYEWAVLQLESIGQSAWESCGVFRKFYLRIIKNWRSSLTKKENRGKV